VGAPVSVPLSCTYADGDQLALSIAGAPSKGTLGAISASAVTYTPNAGEFVADSFNYKANDGDGDSAPATVSITITRPPACDLVTAADVTLSCTDPEGDAIALELGKKATVIGRLTRSIDGSGQLKGKLTAKAKDALKKARSVKVSVRGAGDG
jgi:hypothetical protein